MQMENTQMDQVNESLPSRADNSENAYKCNKCGASVFVEAASQKCDVCGAELSQGSNQMMYVSNEDY